MAVATGPVDVSTILAKAKFLSHTVDKDDDLSYDLGNLTAIDGHPIDPVAYGFVFSYLLLKIDFDCMFTSSKNRADSEKHIKAVGRDNLQLLFNKIFSLPTDKTGLLKNMEKNANESRLNSIISQILVFWQCYQHLLLLYLEKNHFQNKKRQPGGSCSVRYVLELQYSSLSSWVSLRSFF